MVVFSKRKYNNKKEFLLNNEEVEVKDSYTYLGLLFNYNGNLCQGRNKLVDQAQKDMYALYRKNYNLAIPVDLQLKLYDSLVTPILLYGVLNVYLILKKIHLQICKRALSVRSSTPIFMVYGELCRFPLELQTQIKMICFWYKLVSSENKLSGKLYQLLLTLHSSGSNTYI